MNYKISPLYYFVLICIAAAAGCTAMSPISFKQMSALQLQEEWAKYQQDAATKLSTLQDQITHLDQQEQAGINGIKSSIWNQMLGAINDPQNTGVWTTTITAVFGALGVGLHINNLRLDRKIAHPEVPKSGDELNGDSDQAGHENGNGKKDGTVPTSVNVAGTSRGDLSLQGAAAAVAANFKNN